MSSKPAPGQPVANVEYRRRNQYLPTILVSAVATPDENPRKGGARHPFELAAFPQRPAGRVSCRTSDRLEARTMCDSTQPGPAQIPSLEADRRDLARSHDVSPGMPRWHAPCPELSRDVRF
jgi:hypothetical protein